MAQKRVWWKEAVVYQIYPRSFSDSNGDGVGDLPGILSRLDYLRTLGVDVLWLSPIYRSPGDDNGYDISDYQAIMKEFGTMEDFDRLLDEAHARGLKIVLDLVVNHTSDEHPWFLESRASRDSDKRDFYLWRDRPNGWECSFSGPAWEKDEATGQYYLHLFSKKQPDLNWANPAVRREVFAMMRWWLDKGIDGFRMDVINLIGKAPEFPGEGGVDFTPWCQNRPEALAYLSEMNREVLSHYDILTVGETPGVTPELAREYTAERAGRLNMVFTFEHMELDGGPFGKWSDRRIPLPALKRVLSRWQDGLRDEGWNSLYWDNHDQPRIVSRLGDEGPYWKPSAKMLAICLHLLQGTPYIYQGEELGMTNAHFDSLSDYRDIESLNAYRTLVEEKKAVSSGEMLGYLALKSRDNARTPMQWDASEHAGFTDGTPWIAVNPNYRSINAAAQIDDPSSVFSCYRALIALRHTLPVIVYGDYACLDLDDPAVYAYTRTLGEERLLVVCNFTRDERSFVPPSEFVGTPPLIGSYDDSCACAARLPLRPFEAVAYRVGP